MQYWKPDAENEFAGDMMPFWDGRRFHLFYLLDRDHHAEQGGLGGHQWAHASTLDLGKWQHHPLALPIGAPGSCDQHGICTGSIFEHEGVYHAFYATRTKRPDGSVFEAICRASSKDLVHFIKSPQNPLFTAPAGMDPRNHRDPFVFRDPKTGVFHMLVTASQAATGAPHDGLEHGVLAHYTSQDLEQWHTHGPFLALDKDPCPECPEHFFWNDWWYLIYSQGAQMQYWVSREPLGPWRRARRDSIEGPTLAVPRTASFTGGRRLAVGFLGWRQGDRDEGGPVYAGNVLFRELIQDADGTLATRFVPEMMPNPVPASGQRFSLEAGESVAVVQIPQMPVDAFISLTFVPAAGTQEYGLLLRADGSEPHGYRLCFLPHTRQVTLHRGAGGGGQPPAAVHAVEGLDQAVDVAICMKNSVLDVCINQQRTLVARGFDYRGTRLDLFARAGKVRIEDLSITPLEL